jgi:cytochrome P450
MRVIAAAPYDPMDPAHIAERPERLARARREHPVSEPAAGVFFVARAKDVKAVLLDATTFSNAANYDLGAKFDLPRFITQLDPPEHTRLRRLLRGWYLRGAVAALEPRVRDVVRATVARLRPTEPVDLMAEVAEPVPAAVVYAVIGFPEADWATVEAWQQEIAAVPAATAAVTPAFASLRSYVTSLVADRRAKPAEADGIIDALLHAKDEGRRLSNEEVVAHALHHVAAGTETTTALIGNLLGELLTNRGAWDRLLADRGLTGQAVEESLRQASPIQWVIRTATADTEIACRRVPASNKVVAGLQSANWDEQAWGDDAHLFSLERDHPEPHVAFGHGIHVCLGAALSRLEARIVLEALLDAYPKMAPAAGFATDPVPNPALLRPRRLDVVLAPA